MPTTAAPLQWSRVVELDTIVRERGWHLGVVQELIERWKVNRSTVYSYKRRSDELTRRHIKPEDVATYKARQVQLLDDAARKALAAEDFASVARLVKTQAEIIGTIAPVKLDARLTVQAVQIPVVVGAAGEPPRALTVDELTERIEAESRRKAAIETTAVPVGAPSQANEDDIP